MQLMVFDADRPWCQQPCDTPSSFSAFEHYLALEPPRALSKLAALWALDDLVRWRDECAWIERAFAIDAGRRTVGERDGRHLAIVQDTAELVTLEVRKLLRKAEAHDEPVLEVKELVKLMKDVVTLERLITGGSTENVAVAAEFDLSRLTMDEIETMRMLEEKAGVNTRE